MPDTTDQKNRNRVYYQPLVYALLVAAGVWIGSTFLYHGGSVTSSGSRVAQLIEIIESQYVDSIDKHAVEDDAIVKILSQLDPHSSFIPSSDVERVNQGLRGSFVGIGIEFEVYRDTVLILRVFATGPAEEAGIKVGDRLLRYAEGKDTASYQTLIGIQSSEVIERLKGKAGSPLKLHVFRKSDSTEHHIEVLRDNIAIPSITSSFMLEPGIGYVRIERFSEPTHKEFLSAITRLKGKGSLEKLIIDLRSNPGGYLHTAISLLDEFFDNEELLAYTRGKGRYKKEYKATKGGVCTKMGLVVLVNGYSASASEIFSGAIQDHDRGLVVGMRTYGKGLVQETFRLADGAQLRLTVSRYYVPSGRSIQKPYDTDLETYHTEVMRRRDSTLTEVDSSIIFRTKGGRIVFGGGGIQPDIAAMDRPDTIFKAEEYSLVRKFLTEFSDQNFALITSFQSADSMEFSQTLDSLMRSKVPVKVTNDQLNYLKEELSGRFYGQQATRQTFSKYDAILQAGLKALHQEDPVN